MNKSRKLAALFTGTAAVMMLTGTSAFAESRHRAETRRDGQQQAQTATSAPTSERAQVQTRVDRFDTSRQQSQRADRSQQYQRSERNDRSQQYQRNDRYNDRSQNYDRGRSQSYRNDSRRNDSRSYSRPAYRSTWNRAPVSHERRFYAGRVERYEPYRGGFRVWIGGAPYPFFVTANLWHRFGIRVGAVIRLGGYWDPIGYYDAYDYAPYAYSQGDLRGVVENVDYYRRTVVLRDDISGAFVTAVLRGGDPRLGSLRPGDYVDLNGAWSRSGLFDAYSIADLRPYGYQNGPAPYDDGGPY